MHRVTAHALGQCGRALLDALWPQTCLSCGRWIGGERGPLCPSCATELDAGAASACCRRCGRTLAPESIHAEGCARCRTEDFWNVGGVARVCPYSPAMRRILLGLKYASHERNAAFLADRMVAAMRAHGWVDKLDALVPVPMHWLRRLQRPCNHAALLASALARRLRLPVVPLVRRTKHGPSQVTQQTKSQRFENVRDCFGPPPRWRRWLPRGRTPDLTGRTVCIVDNLLVAGATVYEVSKVLRRAGARRIYAVVAARSPAPGDPPASLDALLADALPF
jgi:predicted amidophosphoribosyltransferase